MSILSIILIAAFLMHGLAHLSGFFAAWTRRDAGFSQNPWLFSKGLMLKSNLGRVFGLLWLVAAIVLVWSGLSLLFRTGMWPLLPITGALLSLLVIVPWWNTIPPGAKVGAIFDLLILLALLPPWREQILQTLMT